MSQNLNLRAIKLHGFRFEIYTNKAGQLCASRAKLLTSGKNKGQYKTIEAFAFRSEDARAVWVTQKVDAITKKAQAKAELAAKFEAAKKENTHPYKVGQVLYDSWGWEQTNIDFYQIIDIKGSTATIQKMSQVIVPGSEGNMSENVKPGKACGKIYKKRIVPHMSEMCPEGIRYTISSPVDGGWLMDYTYGEKGVYQSHYA